MRKLLSLLGVLTLGSITTTNVVACSNKPQVDPANPADQSKLPFLYHEVKVTNLGDVKNDARDILTAFQNQNSNIKDDTLKVTDITNKTATINVDQYDTHFKKGTLHVTFNSIESKDLAKLITVKNVYANRNLDKSLLPVPTKIQPQDVLDGINALNGLNLTLQDVTVTLSNQDSATITAKQGSEYQGTDIPVILNKNLDIAQIFTNTDLGDVYFPQELIDKFQDSSIKVAVMAFLCEYIGDANRLLEEFTDKLANAELASVPAITFDKNQLTIDADATIIPKDNPLHDIFNNKVTFNFNINVDNRLSIDKVIKTVDLKTPASTDLATIKQAIIDQNQTQLKSFSSEEVNNYLIVTLPDKTNSASANVSWLPGSKNFLGHDPRSILAAQLYAGGVTTPPLNINVYFGIIKNDFVIQNATTGKTIFDNLHSYLKNTYQLSNDDSVAAIADFAVWYDDEEISNDDKTQISTEGNKPVTIKITLKTNVDDKYKTDLQKLIDNGFTLGSTYVSNTDVTDKK